jgi:hypothetical protein
MGPERFDHFNARRIRMLAKAREQRIRIHRRQRTEAEADLGRRRDHVRLDAAFDAPDVEAQAREPAEPRVRLRVGMIERARGPANGLVHGAVACRVRPRGVPCATGEADDRRADAAMREHGFATRRLGDNDGLVALRMHGEKAGDAAGIVRFLVGREEKRRIAIARIRRRQQDRGRALDVAGAESDCPLAVDAKFERTRAPVRRIRHRVDVHVEELLRPATYRVQADRTRAMVDRVAIEPGELIAQVREDAVGADRTRRIARVESDECAQVLQRCVE